MLKSNMNIEGRLRILKYTLNGTLVAETENHNSITVEGRRLVANLFMNKSGENITSISHMKLGRSKDPFNANDTNLKDPIETKIEFKNKDTVSGEVVGDRVMVRYIGEIEKDQCNDALKEAGLFTDEGVMYNRVTFDQITKSEQFKLTLIWEITF